MRLTFYSLLILAASASTAQTVEWERLYPAALGDAWVYEYSTYVCTGQPSPGCTTTRDTLRFDVVGFATVGGHELPVYQTNGGRFAAGIPGEGEERVVDVLEGEPMVFPGPTQSCCGDWMTVDFGAGSIDLTISGISYTFLGMRSSLDGGPLAYVPDLGFFTRSTNYQGPGGIRRDTRWTLLFATVGGEAYGMPPVVAQPLPSQEAARLAVWPNPVQSRATLYVSAREAERLSVAVYDVRGREVWAERLAPAAAPRLVEIETEGWAPGTYLARVRSASGVTTATFAVVRG